MKTKYIILFFLVGLLALNACKEDDKSDPTEEVKFPEITSMTATKSVVEFGGKDPTVISCEATGGNLSYTWYVDLGDLIPVSEDKSVIQYTASDCCIGDKMIFCEVENNLGSVTDTISIFIQIP
jgi:hypothetical protein